MNSEQIFVVVTFALGVVCASACYWFGIRQMVQYRNARFSGHVIGHVTKASATNYCGAHVPECSYEVDGRTYAIVGPKFLFGNTWPGLKYNITDREHLPLWINVPPIRTVNYAEFDDIVMLPYEDSPIGELYPIGSEVDIYYDPDDPSLAYVERLIPEGLYATVFLETWSFLLILVSLLLSIYG